MSSFKRRLFLCIIGVLAGLAAWPVAETVLLFQQSFPSFLVFSVFLGALFGIVTGTFFGSSDGIIMSSRRRIIGGMMQGLIIGSIGGAAGFLTGQFALFITGEYLLRSMKAFNTIGLPLSRALGWALLGLFAGAVDGVRSRSLIKIRVGILGGISGGFLGGLALEYLALLTPGLPLGRLAGLVIFGLSMGFMYGLVEVRLSWGVLTLLNGRYKGRDFLINQRKLKMGTKKNADIILSGYRDVSPEHAMLKARGDELIIGVKDRSHPIYVNDCSVGEHQLKIGDVVRLGTARLLYHFK